MTGTALHEFLFLKIHKYVFSFFFKEIIYKFFFFE